VNDRHGGDRFRYGALSRSSGAADISASDAYLSPAQVTDRGSPDDGDARVLACAWHSRSAAAACARTACASCRASTTVSPAHPLPSQPGQSPRSTKTRAAGCRASPRASLPTVSFRPQLVRRYSCPPPEPVPAAGPGLITHLLAFAWPPMTCLYPYGYRQPPGRRYSGMRRVPAEPASRRADRRRRAGRTARPGGTVGPPGRSSGGVTLAGAILGGRTCVTWKEAGGDPMRRSALPGPPDPGRQDAGGRAAGRLPLPSSARAVVDLRHLHALTSRGWPASCRRRRGSWTPGAVRVPCLSGLRMPGTPLLPLTRTRPRSQPPVRRESRLSAPISPATTMTPSTPW